MQGFRRAAVHLALVALLLRALLPAGWMPNPQGASDSPFVICTMDGPILTHDGQTHDGKSPAGKDDPRAHEACPFAAAAPLAPAGGVIAIAAPVLGAQDAFAPPRTAPRMRTERWRTAPPRAPPLNA